MCVHVHVSEAYSCRRLAYTLVCVNVALAVRAGVCHILEVINQTGNQAAAEVTPGNEEQKYYVADSNTCTWLYALSAQKRRSECLDGRKKQCCLNMHTSGVSIAPVTLLWLLFSLPGDRQPLFLYPKFE